MCCGQSFHQSSFEPAGRFQHDQPGAVRPQPGGQLIETLIVIGELAVNVVGHDGGIQSGFGHIDASGDNGSLSTHSCLPFLVCEHVWRHSSGDCTGRTRKTDGDPATMTVQKTQAGTINRRPFQPCHDRAGTFQQCRLLSLNPGGNGRYKVRACPDNSIFDDSDPEDCLAQSHEVTKRSGGRPARHS